jgi:tRNA-dihydrouridine synthase A
MNALDRRLCVAPMMDWSDRHCRFLHRLLAPHALLYTEMIVSTAVVRGNAARLLEYHAAEHPVALQLGGCDPQELAAAARIGESFGYDEINLNVGCPSDRVKSGAFGACLMLEPMRVADCVSTMRAAVKVPVTVKCRIGINDQDSYEFFARFVSAVADAGVDALIVHARAAILGGLSPQENREIPPLRHGYVHRVKAERPGLTVVINGGFTAMPAVLAQAGAGMDGIMLGRAAYHDPLLLSALERALIDPGFRTPSLREIVESMVNYAREQATRGVRLHSITRHMHGLMTGRNGARAWRRFLSQVALRPDSGPEILLLALPILNEGPVA